MNLSKEKYIVQLNIKGENCPQMKVYNKDNEVVESAYCPDIESECNSYDDVCDYVKIQFFNDWTEKEFDSLVEVEIY